MWTFADSLTLWVIGWSMRQLLKAILQHQRVIHAWNASSAHGRLAILANALLAGIPGFVFLFDENRGTSIMMGANQCDQRATRMSSARFIKRVSHEYCSSEADRITAAELLRIFTAAPISATDAVT